MKFSIFQDSRKGGRKLNEDSMGYCHSSEALMLVVADGMGGHPQGEVASKLALNVMFDCFQTHATPRLQSEATFLETALLQANQALVRYARLNDLEDSPRTTLVAAVIQDGRMTWIHCGDSRLYVVRQGRVFARTLDHSLAERDRQLGRLDANTLPASRNALFTCIGSVIRPIFNISGPLPLCEGDRILLCSDGMWSVMEEQALADAVQRGSVEQAVPLLVAKALRMGGPHSDNVTCVAMNWEEQSDFATTISDMLLPEHTADAVGPEQAAAVQVYPGISKAH